MPTLRQKQKDETIKKLTGEQFRILMDMDKAEVAMLVIGFYTSGMNDMHWTGMSLDELEQELKDLGEATETEG